MLNAPDTPHTNKDPTSSSNTFTKQYFDSPPVDHQPGKEFFLTTFIALAYLHFLLELFHLCKKMMMMTSFLWHLPVSN
jgi:hypothetical protein